MIIVAVAIDMEMDISGLPSAPTNFCRARERVYTSSDFKINLGHTYSFHELIKKMIAVEMTAGRMIGNTIFNMIVLWGVFSSRATSINAFGMDRICCRSKKIPIASLN